MPDFLTGVHLLKEKYELDAADIKTGKFVLRDVLPVRIQVDDGKF